MKLEKNDGKTGKIEKDKNSRMIVVPDDSSDVDSIGYIEYSAGLVEMIRSVKAKGSFTIGIFGQWGQGKTSMLRQIEKELNEISEIAGKEDEEAILTVWFNPWQFTGEEHIIVPFFHTLVSAFKNLRNKKKTIIDKISEKAARFLKELAEVPIALAYGLEGNIKIPLLLESKFSFKEAVEESRRQKIEREQSSKTEFENLVEKYESLYYSLISRLQNASKDINLKIVVFIDDLDRCLPEKAVELLEGIKVLLDISGFVFVVGVAREVIERGIRVRYRELYRDFPQDKLFMEQDYLDKIIQFPFTLPPPDEDLLYTMVEGYLTDLKEVKPYLLTIHKVLGTNPRCLKRFVNNLSYTFWVANKKIGILEKEEKFLPELLVKMTLIAFVFPRLYQVVGKTPLHLIRIQDYLRKKTESGAEKKKEVEEMGKDVLEKEQSGKEEKNPNDFIEISELNLFERPYVEIINDILAFEERDLNGEKVKDKGFRDEKEVRQYVSLLTVTSVSEKITEPTGNIFIQTMDSRMKHIPGDKILLKDEVSGSEFTAEVRPFLLDKYPVTQDLYWKVTGKRPSEFEGDDKPVDTVSWFDAVDFCNLLSEKSGFKKVYTRKGKEVTCIWEADGFRLPTEAEWEYACRAGTTGDRYGEIDTIAWYDKNSKGSTQGVGQKLPNEWGLYDMLGNVWEWCWDWYGKYPVESQADWRGPADGTDRVLRGGSWGSFARRCRSSFRNAAPPSLRWRRSGVRLARSL